MVTIYHQESENSFDFRTLSNKVKKLAERDVHLWKVNRDVFSEIKNQLKNLLSEVEQIRAQRFQFRKDHDLFVIGRTLTKVLLAYYTESTPENVKIIPDTWGKPTCKLNLFFNISHSGNQLLLGFSNSKIGVDIERIDPAMDIEKIGESHFSENEYQKMMNCTKDERIEKFYEIWTKKESLVKGIGKGLSIPLQSFNVTNPNGKVLWEFPNEEKYGNWYVHSIETKQGYKSAFAYRRK